MSTWQQVLHVWQKDSIRTRWLFLAVCGCLALSAIVTRPPFRLLGCRIVSECEVPPQIVAQLLCGLAAVIFVAAVVHEDSPISVRAFWRTQPVSARAVLIAKVLYACVALTALALLVQVWSIFVSIVPLQGALGSLGVTSYWITSFLLFAILVASLTSSTQTYVLMWVGVGILRMLVESGLVGLMNQRLAGLLQTSNARADVWLAVAVTTIAYVFLARSGASTVRSRIPALVSLAVLTISWNAGWTVSGVRFLSGPRERPDASLPPFRASLIERDSGYTLRIETDAPPPGHRYALRCSDIAYRFENSRSTLIWPLGCEADQPFYFHPDSADARVVSAVFYLGRRTGLPDGSPPSRTTAVLLRGFLESQTTSVVGRIPATPGAEFVHHGSLIRTLFADSTVTNNAQRKGYVSVIAASTQFIYGKFDESDDPGSRAAAYNAGHTIRFSRSGFNFRVLDSASTRMSAAPVPAKPFEMPYLPFALPAPGLSTTAPQLFPNCGAICSPAWWNAHDIEVSRWEHVSFKPIYVELPVQR